MKILRTGLIAIVVLALGVLLGCARSSVKQKTLIFGNTENEKRAENLKGKLKVNSNDAESRMELARIFLSEDMIEDAIAEYEKVLDIDSQNIQAYLLLSSVLQKRQNPDLQKIAVLLEKATKIAPDNADIHLNLAQIFDKQAEEGKAINEFNKAIELSDDPATLVSAHLGLMAIYKEQGNFERANAEYELAYTIYPGIEEMIKQAEINRITPAPKYAGEEFRGEVEDGIHPQHEERITRIQKEIKKVSEEEN